MTLPEHLSDKRVSTTNTTNRNSCSTSSNNICRSNTKKITNDITFSNCCDMLVSSNNTSLRKLQYLQHQNHYRLYCRSLHHCKYHYCIQHQLAQDFVFVTCPPTCSIIPLIAVESTESLTFLPIESSSFNEVVVVIPTFNFLGRVVQGLLISFWVKSLPVSKGRIMQVSNSRFLTEVCLLQGRISYLQTDLESR